MADGKGPRLVKDFQDLMGNRLNWESHWDEIANRFYPMHRNLFSQTSGLHSKGEKRNQDIFDSTAVLALGRFGAILDSLLTPRSNFWHQIRPTDRMLLQNKGVRDWFEVVNTILFEQRYAPTANFASQNQLQYKSLGAYGSGALFIDSLETGEGLRYRNVHLSEIYLRENHQGIVDSCVRHFVMTARQAFQRFGEELPNSIKDKAKSQPNTPFFFLHWVKPRAERDPDRIDALNLPFVSYYVSIQEQKLLEEGGFQAFPYAISRYEQSPNEAYGRSPAMDVMPAVKTLNEQKKALLKQGHFAVDPVILMHNDGIMDAEDNIPGSFVSGGVSPDGRLLVQPMPVGNVQAGKDMMDDERALINDSFLVTLFQILVENPQQTATEVIERTREKGILLAPTIGRQQSEYLGPMITRELDILSFQGLLPPQPRMLEEAGGDFEIIYDSPITRSQKAEWVAGANRTIEILLNASQATQDPTIMAYINWDEAAPAIADILGTPSTWMNSKEQVAEIKARIKQQQEEQVAIQAAPAAAGLAKATA